MKTAAAALAGVLTVIVFLFYEGNPVAVLLVAGFTFIIYFAVFLGLLALGRRAYRFFKKTAQA